MLPGVTPFPPEFAALYRAKGYWEDRTIASVWEGYCRLYAGRIAMVDGEIAVSYAQVNAHATNLALNLLDLGIKPLDRLVVQLPNRVQFVYLYLALQKIGAIPVMALPAHRYLEISQFVGIAGTVGCVMPDKHREFDFRELVRRIRKQQPQLKHGIVLGEAPDGFASLDELIARKASRDAGELARIRIDPTDPALFLLSGGTTGVPKLIPRTHNDYVYNSKMACSVTGIDEESVLLDVLPISHNLPLACPGLQGFIFKGARVVLSTDASPQAIFRLVEKHRVTHIHVVPALLIRWINDSTISNYDLSSVKVIQSGGQRLQPETRAKTQELIPSVTVQENFGMAEGVLMFVRLDDPLNVRLETVGRPICPDDEIMLLDEDDNVVAFGEVGEFCCRGPYTLRGYYGAEEHNKRVFTPDGFYRSGDLMRQHSSGNYMVEGRKKDLINRGGEKISAEEIENLILSHPAVQNVACVPVPDAELGERMCACLVLQTGATLSFDELIHFLEGKEMAKIKLPERLLVVDELPLSNFGKVSKKRLSEMAAERGQLRSKGLRV
ncbi:MAG: 2,3-dihydroxybenzoate---[aryl-carrier protein] ligase [Alphaproteobacteria bacterium]|jgi:2,3-dihydroxybenzoate-AMP ligase|nr:2,3-dihydroxybenzoate---[aryl-carrier protein] ligase [Alphaproteobacteria bacterium]